MTVFSVITNSKMCLVLGEAICYLLSVVAVSRPLHFRGKIIKIQMEKAFLEDRQIANREIDYFYF